MTPPRPRGRPRSDNPTTAAQRNRAYRKRGARAVILSPEAAADLATLRSRDGDASNAGAVHRAIRAALAHTP